MTPAMSELGVLLLTDVVDSTQLSESLGDTAMAAVSTSHDRVMKQTRSGGLGCEGKKRRTRREKLLGDMDKIVPWARLEALIAPHCPRSTSSAARPSACRACRLVCTQIAHDPVWLAKVKQQYRYESRG